MIKNTLSFTLLLLLGYTVTTAQTLVPDLSFGKKGQFKFSNGAYNEVKDLKPASDGSIFVLMESIRFDSLGNRDMDIILLKLLSSGMPDPAFANKGILLFDYHGLEISRAAEIAVQADGKILVAGDGNNIATPKNNPTCITRIFPSGTIDKSFGNSGTLAIGFNNVSYLGSMKIVKDTTLFIAGSYSKFMGNHSDVFPVIAKLNTDGKVDTHFGGTGKVSIDYQFDIISLVSMLHTAGGQIYDMLIQEDGKILVCGGYIFKYSYEGFVARFLPDGKLDLSFNSKGYIQHDFTPGRTNYIKKMVLYDSNTLLLGGVSQKDFDADFCLGIVDLKSYKISVTEIDFKGQQDVLEDLSVVNGQVVLSGRTILPENAALYHECDLFAMACINDINKPAEFEPYILKQDDTRQHGILSHMTVNDKIITGGFVYTSNALTKDAIICCYKKSKNKKKK